MLARQLLLQRSALPVPRALQHLVGLQAQVPQNPYVALWSRLRSFRAEQLSRLIVNRQAVRLALQRSTIHLVTRRDSLALRPALQAVQERNFLVGSPYGRRLKGVDLTALVAAGRALLDESPRTPAELGKLLRARFPRRDPTAMAYALRNLAALVQVPPRGLWGEGGQTRHATVETWLSARLDPAPDLEGLVVRFLRAFGPASVQDMQQWSGLTRMQEIFDRLAKRLRRFQDDQGVLLYDLPRAPRPDPGSPAPIRFLPEYDNVFLSHVDRRRITGDFKHARVKWSQAFGLILVDGFLQGAWRVERKEKKIVLQLQPVARWTRQQRSAVDEEGQRLTAFLNS